MQNLLRRFFFFTIFSAWSVPNFEHLVRVLVLAVSFPAMWNWVHIVGRHCAPAVFTSVLLTLPDRVMYRMLRVVQSHRMTQAAELQLNQLAH
jgi:hypothetical protein